MHYERDQCMRELLHSWPVQQIQLDHSPETTTSALHQEKLSEAELTKKDDKINRQLCRKLDEAETE
jgi:hypothetical protein